MVRPALALLLVAAPTSCQSPSPEGARVQRALRVGAAGALAARVAVSPPARPDPSSLPRATEGDRGLRFEADDAHQSIASVRVGEQMALAWTNLDHDGLWFGTTDLHGVGQGAAQRIYAAAEGEERAEAPSVVATAQGFAVAWVDGENGRVMFRRLNAQRRPVGRAVIVHEGLSSPRSVSLAPSGDGFGLAAALFEGVYFAQLDASGARVDDGTMVSEGEPVTAMQPLRWERDAFTLAWTVTQNGRAAQVERRLSASRRGRPGPVG
ncbi:MAG: hypothetical protein R3A48_02290 [Polyangiales bacterium]